MCGIVGFSEPGGGDLALKAELMARRLAHRGPDDVGVWSDKKSGLAFAHRRLSILDLSPLGHQPMRSSSGRYTISFNGEVYNFRRLVPELTALGHTFRGASDTEVMLAAFEQWGIEDAVRRFIGMFAFAVWDEKEQVLSLVRDRLGVKPLYYGWCDDVFLFGSELKALRAHPRFRSEIDRNAAAMMLRFGYIPAPVSIYRGIFKVRPGVILPFSLDQLRSRPGSPSNQSERPIQYWSLGDIAYQSAQRPAARSYQDSSEEFERLLEDSVRLRMISDVPLGAFLSGGIDSSLIVAMMQRISGTPVRTFTIGFDDPALNEAPFAQKIAAHLGTAHTELYVTARDALEVIPKLPEIYDEPFADPSQIPTYLLSSLTRKSVTVSLSGDGGDELSGGYSRYAWALRAGNLLSLVPNPLRGIFGSAINSIPDSLYSALTMLLRLFSSDPWIARDLPGKAQRLAEIARTKDFDQFYLYLLSYTQNPELLVPQSRDLIQSILSANLEGAPASTQLGRLQRMMLLDSRLYLPDDILVKLDRASMAVSLEAREPLLDHRLWEFVWSLPQEHYFHLGRGKRLLRTALERSVPRQLFERPKRGFGVPLAEWLRTDLREWGADLLANSHLAHDGLLNQIAARQLWEQHQRRQANRAGILWNILMFESWFQKLI